MNKKVKSAIQVIDNFILTHGIDENIVDIRSDIAQLLIVATELSGQIDLAMDNDFDLHCFGIFDDSLGDLTWEQEIKVSCFILSSCRKDILSNSWGIGTIKEWISGNLIEFFISLIREDKAYAKNIHRLYCELKGEKYSDEDHEDFINEHLWEWFGATDSTGICRMFYVSGWTDDLESYMAKGISRIIRDFKGLWSDHSNEFFRALYEDDEPHDTIITTTRQVTNKQEKLRQGKLMDKHLYLMKCNRNGLYKIGISNNPQFREKTLCSDDPSIKLVGSWDKLSMNERDWHDYFAEYRVRGEWFKLSEAQVRLFCHKCTNGQTAPIKETA